MAIPDFQSCMLPLLQLASENARLTMREARKTLTERFKLSEDERSQLLPSGKQRVIDNRIGWAASYLRKALLLTAPERGVIQISERGKELLSERVGAITLKLLTERFPEFSAARVSEESTQRSLPRPAIVDAEGTPEEVLEEAYSQLKNQVLAEILDRLKSTSPAFFESLVVDTIVKMGYGGSRKDAGQAIGQSGDEGIDGIINEDRLGLDVIYLQAKRWEGNVGRPEIQKFAGALAGKRARKGIVITTSDYTSDARAYVSHIDAKIILISGRQMAEIMWEHDIGLQTATTYEVKKVDLDYYSEDR